MITTELVAVQSTDSPGTNLRVCTREQGEAWVPGGRQGTFYLTPVQSCVCCGQPSWPNGRCTRHQGRDPCLIEGCGRSTGSHGGMLATDRWLCSEHWRRFVPPRSRLRRAYHAHFRRAKRLGRWTPETIAAFTRFWDSLVRKVRRAATEGQLDEHQIAAMFGWADP